MNPDQTDPAFYHQLLVIRTFQPNSAQHFLAWHHKEPTERRAREKLVFLHVPEKMALLHFARLHGNLPMPYYCQVCGHWLDVIDWYLIHFEDVEVDGGWWARVAALL